MTSEIDTGTAAAAAYNASEKQKGASKTSRIPIKIVPVEQHERLKKPDWIRVKAATASSRFYEIKDILRANNLVTVCEEASCPNIGECFGKVQRAVLAPDGQSRALNNRHGGPAGTGHEPGL